MTPQANKPNAVVLDRYVPGQGVVWETLPEEPMGDQGIHFLENFHEAVRNGKQPRTNLERALVMQKLTDAIYGSAEAGKSVSIQ